MGRSEENEVRKALICGYNFPKVEKLLESYIAFTINLLQQGDLS